MNDSSALARNGHPAGAVLHLPTDLLRPLVAEVVREVLAALEADRAALPADRLCYGEAEAARLLGLHAHQLRDMRLRGEIAHSRIVGNRVAYSRQDLLDYLAQRRVNGQAMKR